MELDGLFQILVSSPHDDPVLGKTTNTVEKETSGKLQGFRGARARGTTATALPLAIATKLSVVGYIPAGLKAGE